MTEIPPDSARLAALAKAYDGDAAARDQRQLNWRAEVLDEWSARLKPGARLIELGAGTGQAAAFLEDKGFSVLAIDLSPANVAKCRQRGLAAIVADMAALEAITDEVYRPPYDGAYAINSLIHFPKRQLNQALSSIRTALVPGAPLLLTLWGGQSSEGHWEDDWCDPPRFFAFYDDAEARKLEFTDFAPSRFTTLDNRDKLGLHSLVLELRAR